MFCFKCGANVPDGSEFCSSCGAVLTGDPTVSAQSIKQEPQAEKSVNEAPKSEIRPLYTKKEYFKNEASEKGKLIYKILPFTVIGCIILSIVTYFTIFNTPIQKIPVASFAIKLGFSIAGESISEFDDFMEEYQEEMEFHAERMELILEVREDDFSKEQVKLVEDFIELYEKMENKLTLNNLLKLIKYTQKAEEIGLPGISAVDFDEYSFLVDIGATVVSVVMFIGILFVYIFSILGGALRNKILVIIGMISTIPYTLAWCGIPVSLFVIAVHAAMLAMIIMVDKEYKTYRMNFKFFG